MNHFTCMSRTLAGVTTPIIFGVTIAPLRQQSVFLQTRHDSKNGERHKGQKHDKMQVLCWVQKQ